MSTARGKGKNARWLKERVNYGGADCLIWPFSRKPDGRGCLGFEGRMYGAHELMCIFAKGPKPSPIHETAHSCGNGHGGCVHPQHVSWKTPTENHIEMVLHGNAHKTGTPRRKLTNEDVAEIKVLKSYLTQAERAMMFGVSNTTIAEIDRGRARRPGPKRHRGGPAYDGDERIRVASLAAQMRHEGATLETIGNALGVARLTARTLAMEGGFK